MKKILLFQVENPMKVKAAIATLHLRVEAVKPELFYQTVTEILEKKEFDVQKAQQAEEQLRDKRENCPKGSLLFMCGLTNQEIDSVLKKLRSHKVVIDYKAVLTPTNQGWNAYELLANMAEEKQAIEDGTSSNGK